jgi:hypothetical protein
LISGNLSFLGINRVQNIPKTRISFSFSLPTIATPQSEKRTTHSTMASTTPAHLVSREQSTAFRNLPFEIKLMIWEFVCLLPRNIDLCVEHPGASSELPRDRYLWNESDGCTYCRATYLPPAILHINQESRAEGLK